MEVVCSVQEQVNQVDQKVIETFHDSEEEVDENRTNEGVPPAISNGEALLIVTEVQNFLRTFHSLL